MTHSGIQGRLLIGAFTFAMAAWTITAAGSPSAGASAGPTTIAVEAVPEPLLSIGSSGGLIDYRFKFSRLPKVVVASTGQLFTQGPTTMIYPGPMLPNVRARTLTKAGVVRLRTLVARAGLDRAADYGRPAIADVPALVIRYLPANATFVTNTLPSFGVHEESLTSAQRAGRAKVRALMVAFEAGAASGRSGVHSTSRVNLEVYLSLSRRPARLRLQASLFRRAERRNDEPGRFTHDATRRTAARPMATSRRYAYDPAS